MNDPQLSKLPSGWRCPKCEADLPKAMSMVGNKEVRLARGMIIICSSCSTPLILGDTELRPLSRQEFDAYSHQVKGTIVATVKAVASKLKAGGEWSPYKPAPGQGGPDGIVTN